MPKFKYKAKNLKGEVITGIIKAPKHKDVVSIILNKNYYPIDISFLKNDLSFDWFRYRSVDIRDLAIFCRQFATTLIAGISVTDSLNIIIQQTENRRFKEVIADLYEVIQKGYLFSESMSAHADIFPTLLVNMVRTGEVSGNLDIVMERMATHYEKEYRINQKLKSSMAYPLIVFIVSIIVVTMLLVFVLPIFLELFNDFNLTLPLITRVFLGISQLFRQYWCVIIFSIVLTIYIIKKYLKTKTGKYNWGRLKLNLPIIGELNKYILVSRFSRTSNILLSSGIDLLKAIEIVKKVVDNEYAIGKIQIINDDIKKGMGLSYPMMKSGIFPPMVYQMIKVGEESGSLDLIFEKLADFYDLEIKTKINYLTSIVEPLMIILLGIIVAFIAVSMILPMFDIYSSF